MESDARVANDGEDEEEDHVNRLMALLHDLVRREGGRSGAARALGVDRRTVGTGMDDGRLTQRLRGALEGALQQENGSAADQPEPNDALERRLEKLEKELHGGLDAVKGEFEALREEHVRSLAKIGEKLFRREAPQENGQESPGPADAPETDKPPAAAAKFPKRLYPELVTKEPAPDDEEVFGEAWPLIEEWREIWKAGHVGTGKGLAWLETEERVRELEVAMLEEHGLTLPPEKQPLHGLYRSAQLDWRKDTLHEVRRAVAWRHLVRTILTCGLWRSRWWRERA